LSPTHSRHHLSLSRFTIALAAPAFALTAIAASGGLSGTAAAAPVAQSAAISAARSASPAVPAAAAARSGETANATLLAASAAAAPRRLGYRQKIAWRMMQRSFHWRPKFQFWYLNKLWMHESSWNTRADNPYSGAYGIPQALPGSKMASAGPRWWSDPTTQIRWGLRYIRGRYGNPRKAWSHECAYGWY
jgi:hypothetical protein